MQNKYLEKHTDINKGFGFLIINNVQMVNMARKLLGLSDKLVNGSKNEGLTLICKETECMVVSKKKQIKIRPPNLKTKQKINMYKKTGYNT